MNVVYPTLSGEIAKRGIKKRAIAVTLGISERALRNKMTGKTPFSWPEACIINSIFFPDVSKDDLFKTSENSRKENGL